MATLPDLDTTQASFVAYWNALDHGVNSIDPEEVVSSGNVAQSTMYDNGVIVEYSGSPANNFKVRVKSDGWFVAYLSREENYGENDFFGPYEVMSGGTIEPSSLSDAINNLQSQLPNSGDIVFSASDVGLYDYYNTSEMVSIIGDSGSYDNASSYPSSGSLSATFAVSSAVMNYAVVDFYEYLGGYFELNGNRVLNSSGAYDATQDLDSDMEHDVFAYAEGDGDQYEDAKINYKVFMQWDAQ